MSEKQYQEIAQLDSVIQIVAYLKKQPGFSDLWADLDENSLHRGDVEKLLTHTIHQNFAKLYRFAKNFAKLYRFANPEQRRFMALYFKRYELSVLKDCLRKVFDEGKAQLDLSLFQDFFDRHSKMDLEKLTSSSTVEEYLEKLTSSSTVEELVNNLQGSEYYHPLKKLGTDYQPRIFDYGMALDQYYFALTSSSTVEELVNNLQGSEYYHPLKKLGTDYQPRIFDYGMALDQYYFANIWSVKEKLFKRRDLEEITKAYGNKFDMLNLQWIFRSKKYLDQYYFANIWSVKEKLFKRRDLEEITKAYGNKFDMLNLQWIFRSKKYYHMGPADIYALLIPVHYRLSKNDIASLVEAPDEAEFRKILDTTYYKK